MGDAVPVKRAPSQQVRRKSYGNIPYVANTQQFLIMPRGNILRELYLVLKGQPTITAANNTAAKTKKGDEWSLIQRLDIVINGNVVIRSYTGDELYWINYQLYGRQPNVSTTLADATTPNPTFNSVLILPFWWPQSYKPLDTALNTAQLSDFRINVQWGSHTSINGDATGFTTTPTLNVYGAESYGIGGNFSMVRTVTLRQTSSGANTGFDFLLPLNPLYRSFLINTSNAAGTPDVSTETTLNNLQLISGSTIIADLSESVLRQVQPLRMNVQRDTPLISPVVGFQYPNIRRSSASVNDAWFYFDLVGDGMMSECVDSLGMSELKLRFDVTGNYLVNVIAHQVWPPDRVG